MIMSITQGKATWKPDGVCSNQISGKRERMTRHLTSGRKFVINCMCATEPKHQNVLAVLPRYSVLGRTRTATLLIDPRYPATDSGGLFVCLNDNHRLRSHRQDALKSHTKRSLDQSVRHKTAYQRRVLSVRNPA